MGQAIGGLIFLKVDGQIFKAKGSFTYSLGKNSREAIVGSDGVHGYKEMPTAPFVEGQISDHTELDLDALGAISNATVTLDLANGKTIVLRNAWHTNADGLTGQTEEGEIGVRFEGLSAEEVK